MQKTEASKDEPSSKNESQKESPFLNKIILGDCLEKLKDIPDNSVDLIVTDPPYGMEFMGKDWDKAVPKVEVWKECLRVLKPGAFAFIMCAPRQDCLSKMIINLAEAGFDTNFTSLYWTYASGFPKAHNIGKAIDKKLGVTRKIVGRKKIDIGIRSGSMHAGRRTNVIEIDETIPTSPQAKAFEGAYGGFQPKPAVEVIIVAMKPMDERTYVAQALKNGKGITWMDDSRIPYADDADKETYDKCCSVNGVYETGLTWGGKKVIDEPKAGIRTADYFGEVGEGQNDPWTASTKGRFPANLLVSDEVLDDGKEHGGGTFSIKQSGTEKGLLGQSDGRKKKPERRDRVNVVRDVEDSGTYSRFFSLDAWVEKNLPFLILPKPSKKEKEAGCDALPVEAIDTRSNTAKGSMRDKGLQPGKNTHPTVKPIKLMAYLITMGSREGDIALDPFAGSGSTCIAAKILKRRFIGIELDVKYHKIAEARIENAVLAKAA